MLDLSAGKVKGFKEKLADEVRFIRNWAENPLTTGAVSPSGPDLTRRMASYLEPDRPGKVLEIGPGHGRRYPCHPGTGYRAGACGGAGVQREFLPVAATALSGNADRVR